MLVFQTPGREDILGEDSMHGATEGSFTSIQPVLPHGRSVTSQRACQAAPLTPSSLVGVHYCVFCGFNWFGNLA